MAVFAQYTDVETIEINDTLWASRVNQNFKRFSSVEQMVFTTGNSIIISNSLFYLGNEVEQFFHRTFFVDTSARSATCTITLPDPALTGYAGKELIFIKIDSSNQVDFDLDSGVSGTIEGDSTSLPASDIGGKIIFTSDGTNWYGTYYDN